MINEYVIDPELIFKAAKDRRIYKDLITSFGVGTPRIVSIFPKLKPSKWIGYIRQHTPSGLSELDQIRVDELINHLKENRISRSGFILDDGNWLHNVKLENTRLAFDVIFTNQENSLANSLSVDQTNDIHSIWDHRTQLTPQRTVEALSAAIGSLLRCSTHIAIVDPYADKADGITSIVGFINTAFTRRVVESNLFVQVYYDGTKRNAATVTYLFDKIKENLADDVKNKLRLEVLALAERKNSEKLHNRYVMSELGGVGFGIGTDVGKESETDDLFLMDKGLYGKRWEQYVGGIGFDILDERSSRVIDT